MSAAETALTEKNNLNVNSPQKPDRRKWFADVFVIVFCVSGAVFSLNLFRLDLFQSIASQNKKPMGAVTVKYNNVQRRFSDRVLWSRLTVESPVYMGDLIRVAEYSAATLNINDGIIDINENSLIRIRASSDGEGRVVIDLNSGSLSITGSDAVESGVALNVMGRVIAPTAKATLSASAGENGIKLQVNEGSAIIIEEGGQSRSMEAGEALILDTKGVEQAAPAAVVMLPRPNAHFIKNNDEPVNIRFAWNVINIDQQQPLRLEFASGSNFTRIVQTAEGINFSNVSLGAGIWYWRLSYQNTVLSSGQFTIADAVMSAPVSPIQNSKFDFRESLPVRFEWQPVEGASYYIIEAGLSPDIKNPLITRQTAVSSYVELGMEAGTWYWRVKPFFSSLYEGTAAFSQVSSFKIDKPVVVVPENDPPANSVTPSLDDPISNSTVIFSNAEWSAYNDDRSKSNIKTAREIIDGMEREVLFIDTYLASGSSNNNWTGASTNNIDFIQKLKNADGVRFKVLGDGKRWNVNFITSDVKDYAYHISTITTSKGKVSNIDISFNRLHQPDWSSRKVKFNKNNLKDFAIERNINNGISSIGAAAIKIFDLEFYQTANDPSAMPAASPESANPVTPSVSSSPQIPVLLPEEKNLPSDVSESSNGFISLTAGWKTLCDNSSRANISIAREIIDGMEREVLTIDVTLAGGNSKWAGATLTEEDFFAKVLMGIAGAKLTGTTTTADNNLIRKLVNANGIHFKVLGDGKRWRVYFPTSNVTDGAYHGVTISTQKEKVSNIDISFDNLNQPDWGNKNKFNKKNLKGITIERNAVIPGGSGTSTIKVFDFEVY